MSARAPGGVTAEFSVCDADQYLDHLACVSVHRTMVVAAEDVYNQFGVLLLRKGTPLGSFAADKLRGHRLNKGVDTLLRFRKPLDQGYLLERLDRLSCSQPDLAEISAHYGFENRARQIFGASEIPSALLQKLAVLEVALPRIFHRALFTSWFALLLGEERGFDLESMRFLLYAGLCHDLGLLHIDPELATKPSDLSGDEWRRVQRHVLRGALIMEALSELPPRLGRIVLQHHERCDGAGYPAQLTSEELDPLSPLIGLGDMLHALRFPCRPAGAERLTDCMPYLRVNRQGFGVENFQAAARIVHMARSEETADGWAPWRRAPLVRDLEDINRSLILLVTQLMAYRAAIESAAPGRRRASILGLIDQLRWVTLSSGIGSASHESWLQRSLSEDYPGRVHFCLLHTAYELFWLLRRIERQLRELLASELNSAAEPRILTLLSLMEKEIGAAWKRLDLSAAQEPVAPLREVSGA